MDSQMLNGITNNEILQQASLPAPPVPTMASSTPLPSVAPPVTQSSTPAVPSTSAPPVSVGGPTVAGSALIPARKTGVRFANPVVTGGTGSSNPQSMVRRSALALNSSGPKTRVPSSQPTTATTPAAATATAATTTAAAASTAVTVGSDSGTTVSLFGRQIQRNHLYIGLGVLLLVVFGYLWWCSRNEDKDKRQRRDDQKEAHLHDRLMGMQERANHARTPAVAPPRPLEQPGLTTQELAELKARHMEQLSRSRTSNERERKVVSEANDQDKNNNGNGNVVNHLDEETDTESQSTPPRRRRRSKRHRSRSKSRSKSRSTSRSNRD